MGGNTGEIQIGSERELYNIFRLLIGVPDYSSESCREKLKLLGFIVITGV